MAWDPGFIGYEDKLSGSVKVQDCGVTKVEPLLPPGAWGGFNGFCSPPTLPGCSPRSGGEGD